MQTQIRDSTAPSKPKFKKDDRVTRFDCLEPGSIVGAAMVDEVGICYYIKFDRFSTPVLHPEYVIDHLPQENDIVLVAAQPYNDHLLGQVAQCKADFVSLDRRYAGEEKPREYWATKKRLETLQAELDDFGWMAHEFVLTRVQGDLARIETLDRAILKNLPLKCLKVLDKYRGE